VSTLSTVCELLSVVSSYLESLSSSLLSESSLESSSSYLSEELCSELVKITGCKLHINRILKGDAVLVT
jgi:hypothetical protein